MDAETLTIIEPTSGWRALTPRFRELVAFRELLFFLVWRDIKVRYKQTAFGLGWAILQPVLATAILWLFFARLAKLPSDGIPYAVFAYAGMLPWQLFSNAVSNSAMSLVSNQALVKKIYFPRLIIPAAAVLDGIPDFFIGTVVLLVLMAAYGITPSIHLLLLPVFAALAVVCALAVGLWLSALNALYRDVRYTLAFLVQLWFFATPVAYSLSLVSPRARMWAGLNPMAGVVEGVRWSILGSGVDLGPTVYVSLGVIVAVLVGGLAFFRRMERTFADVI